MYRRFFRDVCIVAAILLICGAALLIMSERESGQWAVVHVDSVEQARYDLSRDAVYELNGGSNVLVIEDGEAYISSADCPDKLCVQQGHIHGSGQMIVCLPNRLTVTIEGVQGEVELIS